MPRRSASALAVASRAPISSIARLQPPPHLRAHLRRLWSEVTAALPAEWFGAEQGALLERYVIHVARTRELESLLIKIDPIRQSHRYEILVRLSAHESRLVMALARSLRLTLQSRLRAETAATRAGRRPPLMGAAALLALQNLNEEPDDE